MNGLADYISPNIGDYMKYDTAAGAKASLVDFLKIYFADERGRREERIAADKEVRSSKRREDDMYDNYIRNYNNNSNRSKDRRAPNTITLADLLPNMQSFDNDRIRRTRYRESSCKAAHKETNPNKLTLAYLPRPDGRPTIKTYLKDDDG
jgi:hypothetical protein